MLKGRAHRGLLLIAAFCALAPAAEKEISREQARELVLKALKAEGYPTNSPKFELHDRDDPYFPEFHSFSAYFDTPDRFAAIGHYAVNPKTADVWEVMGCRRLKPRAIRALQKSLRKESGLSKGDYKKYSSLAPCKRE